MSKIGQVTDARKVPNWTRNKRLYENETQAIMTLKIGQAIPIDFDSEEQALAARNTIRDALNKEFRRAMVMGEDLPMEGMVTTRVERGTSRAWFTMEDAQKVISGQVSMDTSSERQSTSRGQKKARQQQEKVSHHGTHNPQGDCKTCG